MKKLNEYIKKYLSFLKDDSTWSTMRIATIIMILTATFYITYNTLNHLPVDWFGVSTYIAVALGGKVLQKSSELKNSIE